jgi:hypothetical protein
MTRLLQIQRLLIGNKNNNTHLIEIMVGVPNLVKVSLVEPTSHGKHQCQQSTAILIPESGLTSAVIIIGAKILTADSNYVKVYSKRISALAKIIKNIHVGFTSFNISTRNGQRVAESCFRPLMGDGFLPTQTYFV